MKRKRADTGTALGAVFVFALLLYLVLSVIPARRMPADGIYRSPLHLGELLSYEGWELEMADGTVEEAVLPSWRAPGTDRCMKLVNTLPRSMDTGTFLAFETKESLAEVRIDGSLLYSTAKERQNASFSRWNFVPLETSQAEAQISVLLSWPDRWDTGYLPRFYLGPEPELLLLISSGQEISVRLSMTILLLGCLLLVFAAATFADQGTADTLLLLGLYIALLGLSLLWGIADPQAGLRFSCFRQNMARGIFFLLPLLYCGILAARFTGRLRRGCLTAGIAAASWLLFVTLLRQHFQVFFLLTSRLAGALVLQLIYGFYAFFVLVLQKETSRRVRFSVTAGLICLIIALGAEMLIRLTGGKAVPLRPLIPGALLFSVLHASGGIFTVYDYVEQQMRLSEELLSSRISLMTTQIRPHFIRSSLGAIRSIVRKDPDKAYDLIYDFSNYMTFNMETIDRSEPVPFSVELGHIREYAAIEQVRFGSRVKIVYEAGVWHFLVPPLSVQPFVENAVRHGVLSRKEGGTVCLSTFRADDAYVIVIEDNGSGFDPEEVLSGSAEEGKRPGNGHGIGMKNAIFRLETMVQAHVDIRSTAGAGTVVTITIPKKGSQE